MRADAPGKLVISGAYSVLFGAPALVTAVDLRVVADTEQQAAYESAEVVAGRAILAENGSVSPLPYYDASALRDGGKKIGVGSSAAICVASLALLLREQLESSGIAWSEAFIEGRLLPLALLAHRTAQQGGSGIDVAAACLGGTLRAQRSTSGDSAAANPSAAADLNAALDLKRIPLPGDLVFETWASAEPASTKTFVAAVSARRASRDAQVLSALDAQAEASFQAAGAAEAKNSQKFVQALRQQHAALLALGHAVSLPIVTPEVQQLHELLPLEACFLPSGAGGGDVSLYIGPTPTSETFREVAKRLGQSHVPLSLDAPGVRFLS